MSDTIAAIATARTPAAIGIVRISGADTPAVVDRVFAARSGKCAAQLPLRRLVYGHMRTAEGKVIDDGLCVLFAPESSYTGEWSAELHCHGAPVVLDEVLGALETGVLRLEDVIENLDALPEGCEVVLTGRNPPPALLERADYVTEMKLRCHPYEKGDSRPGRNRILKNAACPSGAGRSFMPAIFC